MKSIKATSGLEVKTCILNEIEFNPAVQTEKQRHTYVLTQGLRRHWDKERIYNRVQLNCGLASRPSGEVTSMVE